MVSLREATSTVPIVFVLVPDPVGAGFVASLSHPGGNATGFTPNEYGMSGKWLELLKEIAPGVTRAADHSGRSHLPAGTVACSAAIQAVAAVARRGGNARSTCAIPAKLSARLPRSQVLRKAVLVVTRSALTTAHRESDRHAGGQHQAACGLPRTAILLLPAALISYGTD